MDNLNDLTVVEPDAGIEVSLAETPKVDDKTKETKIQTPAEGIDELKAALDKSKREAAERLDRANREIAEAVQRANNAEKGQAEARKDAVGSAIEVLNSEKESARRDLRAAVADNDADKIAEAQERIATVAARLVETEKGKLALEEEAARPQPRQPATNSDPVEAFASQLSQRSAQWVRSHPEYVTDPNLNRSMVEAHNYALRQGHTVDSEGYFGAINQRLAIDEPREEPRGRQARQEPVQSPISAPVSRRATSTSQADPTVVRLTREEAATADALGMKSEVYAKHLIALAKEGKINRTF